MKKKYLVLAAVACLSISVFTGCGNKANDGADQATSSPSADDGVMDDVENGVDDAVNGTEDAVDDVIDGTEDAVDDVTGNDNNNNSNNGNDINNDTNNNNDATDGTTNGKDKDTNNNSVTSGKKNR
ncbi:MAG: hypothetical protein HFH73_06075 [Lachnospiraceae bacterium]|nr:hypothetical protein [Lachnospiraceae bacterium]